MPGTWPQIPKPAEVTIKSISQNYQSVTHSLRRSIRSRGGHRWGLDVVYPPMSREEAEPIFAFVTRQLGVWGTFEFVLPVMGAPRGVVTQAPIVDGWFQTGDLLNLKNLNPNVIVFRYGDYIRLSGEQKVYKVLQNVRASAAGTGVVPIAPNIQTSPQDNEYVITTGLTFRCALLSDISEVVVRPPLIYSFAAQMIEVPI